MGLRLTVAGDASEIPARELAQDLCKSLAAGDVEATLEYEPLPEGARGEPTLLGIALGWLGPESIATFLGSLSGFFARSKKLEFTLERNGESITLKSENVSPEEQAQTLATLKSFLAD